MGPEVANLPPGLFGKSWYYYLSGSGMSADVSAFGIHSLEKPGEKRETQFFRSGQAYATAEIEYRIGGIEEELSPNDPIEQYWE